TGECVESLLELPAWRTVGQPNSQLGGIWELVKALRGLDRTWIARKRRPATRHVRPSAQDQPIASRLDCRTDGFQFPKNVVHSSQNTATVCGARSLSEPKPISVRPPSPSGASGPSVLGPLWSLRSRARSVFLSAHVAAPHFPTGGCRVNIKPAMRV